MLRKQLLLSREIFFIFSFFGIETLDRMTALNPDRSGGSCTSRPTNQGRHERPTNHWNRSNITMAGDVYLGCARLQLCCCTVPGEAARER